MRALALLTLSALLLRPTDVFAQAEGETAPVGSKFIVQLDLDAFRETRIGSQLFEAATQAAMHELGDGEQSLNQVQEALGFDPLTEVHGITILGSDFDLPVDDNIQLVIRMGQTTGNLEGLALALPGYESSEIGDVVIHSASPNDNLRVHAAIHRDRDGNHSIVAATDPDRVVAMLKLMSTDQSAGIQAGPAGTFLSVDILQFPVEELGKGPQENIAKMLKGVAVRVGEAEEQFHINLVLTTESEQKAEQLRQMAQGVVAMLALIQDEEDKDLQMVQELLQGLTVEREAATIELNLMVPTEQVLEFLREEADLPI
jgi:hypothetical protein